MTCGPGRALIQKPCALLVRTRQPERDPPGSIPFQKFVTLLLTPDLSRRPHSWRGLYGYAENIQEDKDKYSGKATDHTDEDCWKTIAQIGFSYPLHEMEKIEGKKYKGPENCIDDEEREFFYQVVRNRKDGENEQDSDEKETHRQSPVFTNW